MMGKHSLGQLLILENSSIFLKVGISHNNASEYWSKAGLSESQVMTWTCDWCLHGVGTVLQD